MGANASPTELTEQEAYEIALEAYVYLYPIISMDVSRRMLTNVPAGIREGLGPHNQFHHFRSFPPAEFREVVRPNFDTLYSSAWLDLTAGPMIVSLEDVGDRYFLLPMLDMWTNVFAAPGTRTSGNAAQAWALVPPGWTGAVPEGVEPISAPTPYVWIIGRTKTDGPADYPAVHRVQDGFRITPLSAWGGTPGPAAPFTPNPSVDMVTPPLVQVNTMAAERYFAYGAELMGRNPPQLTDWSTLARLARIGLQPDAPFDLAQASPEIRSAIERAAEDGLKTIVAKAPTIARVVNGWQMNTDSMGVYGNNYLKRAVVAMVGLGANVPEDAIYPLCVADKDGRQLTGDHRYVIHFPKEQLPPVAGFWSITMYDADGFQVANALNRFAIGDRDALRYNPDGSLDIYIQHESPGPDKESNWLPSPASGVLGVTMRLYGPKPPAITGEWNPPAIQRVD